jgi:hypothetical protein
MLDTGIGDEEQDINAVKDMLQRGLIIVVSLSNSGTLLSLLGKFLRAGT